MRKEHKKAHNQYLYQKNIYIRQPVNFEKKGEKNEGNNGDNNGNQDYYIFPSYNCSYHEINESSHSSKKESVTSSIITLNPEKQKENFNIIREPKNLGKEVKKIIQKI